MKQIVTTDSITIDYQEYYRNEEVDVPDELVTGFKRNGLTADPKPDPGKKQNAEPKKVRKDSPETPEDPAKHQETETREK